MTELTKSLLNDAIDEEFNEAKRTEEPVFTSLYEAYAYLKEQIEQQGLQARRAYKQLAYFWNAVRKMKNDEALETANRLMTNSFYAAADCIKVAAMAKEIKEMLAEE